MIFILLSILITISSLNIPNYDTYTFEKYEMEYNRIYASVDRREESRIIFYNNLEIIKNHNSKNEITYFMAVNEYTDYSISKLKKIHGGGYKNKKHITTKDYQTLNHSNELPVSIDWRTKGAVSPVKNQGQCGSCWAHATTETIESQLYLQTGKMLILSPQNVMMCTLNPDDCGGSGGCEGGIAELGFKWAEDGIALLSTVPYTAQDGKCNATVTKAAKTSGYIKLPTNNGYALQRALANVGPIAITVDASTWHLYGGGVYNGCNSTNPTLDHNVQAVGYGVDGTTRQGYWLVRNSWGADWGEEGYIRLYRGPKETCGIDLSPQDGSGCKGDITPTKVCGTCGIWFDNSFPIGLELIN